MSAQRRGSARTSERSYEDGKVEGQSQETRIAVIENEIKHINEKINDQLATKTDIANLKLAVYGAIGSGVVGVIYLLILLYRVLFEK